MTLIRDMSDAETAAHLREYATSRHPLFSWPTDACGYDQSVRFADHRNANWHGKTYEQWIAFILDYADTLVRLDGPAHVWDSRTGRMVAKKG